VKPGREVLATGFSNSISPPIKKLEDQDRNQNTGIRHLKAREEIQRKDILDKSEIFNVINRGLEADDSDICISKTGRFTVRVNLFAGELGKPFSHD
jgi:hypothetical protein